METAKPTVVVTGISGNLGQRLVPLLSDYTVVGIDVTPPAVPIQRFVPLDLGKEESTRELFLLMREVQPASVVPWRSLSIPNAPAFSTWIGCGRLTSPVPPV